MTIISSIDGVARRIYLHLDTVGTSLNPIDVYKEARTLRRLDESLRQFDPFMRADGNVSKGGGKFTERYTTLLDGTRIIPYDATQELTITGTLITDDGQEGTAAFDRTSLTPGVVVDINYVPPQVEVIEVATGGGGGGDSALDIYTYFTSLGREDVFKADVTGLSVDLTGIATSAEIAALNDITSSEIYTYFTTVSREDVFKADLSGVDLSSLATSAEIAALNNITEADVYDFFTNGTRPDIFKAEVSGNATSLDIAALNNLTAAQVYSYFTSLSREDLFKANVSGHALSSEVAALNDVSTSQVKSITDQALLDYDGPTNTEVTSNTVSVLASVAALNDITATDVYTEFTTASNEDVFKADVSQLSTSAEIASLNIITASDVYTYFTTLSREDAFKAQVSLLSTSADIAALNNITASDVYTLFTTGSNEDVFKADVSALSTSAQVTALNNISTLEVKAEIDQAFIDYDVATITSLTADTASLMALLTDIHKIEGLDITSPLQVTNNTRSAGTVTQTILDDGSITTVQRI